MNAERLIVLFPLLPVIGILIIAFGKYIVKREIARPVARLFTLLQVGAGVLLAIAGPELYGELDVSLLDASIRFSFSRDRLWILAAFLSPAVFSIGKIQDFNNETLTTVFLFYLAACSGVLITADIFNFFVFYELMIMAAYVLISVQGKVYASIKYMFVGALSSVFFLTGIIFVYASGLPFSFSALADFSALPKTNAMLIMTFFFTAFSIKSAMFPASPWLPTCHSAGNGTVSAFLSSFTVISGFFGMHYLVLLPAASIGASSVFTLLKTLSLITIVMSALFVFFDTDIKRVIAGSTAFIAGLIGYLFSVGASDLAWIYIFVHAVYKTILFHASDSLNKQPLQLEGRSLPYILGGIGLLFAGGLFPSIPHFIKGGLDKMSTEVYIILYSSTALLIGGFLKFSLKRKQASRRKSLAYTGILSLLILIFLYVAIATGAADHYSRGILSVPELFPNAYYIYIYEGAALLGAVLLAKILFPRITKLANFDSRFLFRTLSIEIFALILLFSAIFIVFNFIAVPL